MKTEIQEKLELLARKRTVPFCYHDYIECPTGRCPKCGSDDLMVSMSGVGVEYGLQWVIEQILRDELTPVNLDERFEEYMRECFPETTTIGFLKDYDTVSAMKELDPIAWQCAQSEWESQEADDDNIISFDGGNTYYTICDIEKLVEGV